MNISVTKNQVSINTDYILNDKEYNVNKCYFSFSEEYTDDLVKKAVFIQGSSKIEMSIINNQCEIPLEVLNQGTFEIHVYAYEVDGEELVIRYSPTYDTAYVRAGSYVENATNTEPLTPTDKEQIEQNIVNLQNDLLTKQDVLISGTNIKTINNESILGEGNIDIQGGGGSSDYTELTNKPKINNVELVGNKTTSDLGIVIPDVSNFITKDVNDLTYYTKTSSLSAVATSGNYNDLSNKPTIPDISGKLDTSKVKNTTSTTAGDVYDVTYINSTLGDIETLLGGI